MTPACAPMTRPTHGPWLTDALAPYLEVDTGKLPANDRFAAWASQIAHSCEVEAAPDVRATHRAHSMAWSIGGLVVSKLDCAPQTLKLLPPGRRQTDPETIQLRVYHGGRSRGLANGVPFETRAGEVHAFDMGRPFLNVTEGARFTSVFLPHALVGFDPSRNGAHGMLAKDCPAARMLASATMALAETCHTTDGAMKTTLVAGYIGLFKALVLGEMKDPDVRRAFEVARKAELKQFIEANLSDPDLSVEAVCRAFGASRATVYRDFAEDGGIRTYIRLRRLEAARRDLKAAPLARGRVRRIAERWGFENQSHFTRAFREAFGLAPGDVVPGDETSGQCL